jgi:hypothetical protein
VKKRQKEKSIWPGVKSGHTDLDGSCPGVCVPRADEVHLMEETCTQGSYILVV